MTQEKENRPHEITITTQNTEVQINELTQEQKQIPVSEQSSTTSTIPFPKGVPDNCSLH